MGNLAWIRLIVIRHEENRFVHQAMGLLCVDKLRHTKTLEHLFKIWNPIWIIIILRLPFITSGAINYLSSFQPEHISVRQCIIANTIGFLPGAVLFTLCGNAVQTGLRNFFIELWNGDAGLVIQKYQWQIVAFFVTAIGIISAYVCL